VARTPFLAGALALLYGDAPPGTCPACGFDWTSAANAVTVRLAGAPDRFAALLDGRDATTRPDDPGWGAAAYVCHLADLARGWAERWVQLEVDPGSTLVPWDPDALAAARGYRGLPAPAALWSLRRDVAALLDRTASVGGATAFHHGDWGPGTVDDALVWVGHEFHHHEHDVAQRVR
jgi:hypothetical protein